MPSKRADHRRAVLFGAIIAKESLDRGAAPEADNRPEQQKMLGYVVQITVLI